MVSGLDNHSSWYKHACSHVNIDGRDFDSYLEKIFVFVQILDSGLGVLVGLPIVPRRAQLDQSRLAQRDGLGSNPSPILTKRPMPSSGTLQTDSVHFSLFTSILEFNILMFGYNRFSNFINVS